MYGDGPETINLGVIERLTHCPAAEGVGTRMPRGALDRWQWVRNAIVSWHNGAEPDEVIADHFAALDEVQRRICTDLFRAYVSLMAESRDRVVDLEGSNVLVPHPTEDAMAQAAVTLTLAGEGGPELVKLRTGQRGSSEWEKAVLLTGKDPEATVVEVMLGVGEVEDLTMPEEARRSALGSVEKVHLGTPTLFKTRVQRTTGWVSEEKEISVYVLTEDGRDFIGLSNICTHLGCRVRWVWNQESFFCPCHNAVFSKTGQVISGPPPRPLDRYDVKVESGQILASLEV